MIFETFTIWPRLNYASTALTTAASRGKYAEAALLFERSQAIREKVLGPEHPEVATALNNRANLLETQVRAMRNNQDFCGPS